ncbi:MAG: S8 family peptidase [Oscillospiraceae bacterium]|jgi:subtilisin family serine protease|nr:S8 family peptidase [Oscillospiraceae bacterium]
MNDPERPAGDEPMSLEDFVNLPTTTDFYTFYTQPFEAYLATHPDIRVGTVLANRVVIAYAPEGQMESIYQDLGGHFLNTFPEIYGLLDTAAFDSAGISRLQQQPYLNLSGQGVLCAFIDTGIDYTQPSFLYEDGTSKIKAIWDQTLTGSPPPTLPYGAMFTQEQLNQALQNENPFDTVPHRDTVGHGTFLASVTAGREPGNIRGAAPDAEILVVKLRRARPYNLEVSLFPPEQENAFEASDIMLGIKFCLDRAYELNRPCVITLALGTNFGGHDGGSMLERYISILSTQVGIAFCLAAGNEGNARHHTTGLIAKTGDDLDISVQILGNSNRFGVYIWYPSVDTISLSLISPTGEMVNRIPFSVGTIYQRRLVLENAYVRIFYHQDGSRFATVQVVDATPGFWRIILHGDLINNGRVHAWLPMTGFVGPDVSFTEPTPDNTIVVPATGLGGIVVTAYDSSTNSLYLADSWGPSGLPRILPDFAAPGVNVQGIYPTGPGRMSGTSVAAAVTAGASALMLQWGVVQGREPSMNSDRLRALFIRGCVREESIVYPNEQWGYGRLDLFRSFSEMREA